ncbi:MAG: DUF5666 domain-containing protein [Treponemataceae bacterium]
MSNGKLNKVMKTVSLTSIILIAALAFSGCPSGVASTGTAGVSGYAKGVITAKGSIFVNGVEYETTSSTVTLDNASGGENDLQVGMYVELTGSIDSNTGRGVANAVNYSSSIEGTIDAASINVSAGTFTIFGTTVQTDAATVYEHTTGFSGIGPLSAGNLVEVSGTLNSATNSIRATRVEKKSVSEDFKLKGTVSGLSGSTNGTFTLTLENGTTFTVNFTGTLNPSVVNGVRVKVEFAAAPSLNVVNTTAAKIEARHQLSSNEGDRGEVSGIVSAFNGTTEPVTFVVDGTTVNAASSLVVGVANGIRVEVKGSMTAGVLIATEVRIEKDADLEMKGVLTAVNPSAGTVAVNGVVLYVEASTIFKDDTTVPVVLFGLANLSVGNYAEANAFVAANGKTTAAKIERKEISTEAELTGIVTAISGNVITVLGLDIDTSSLTRNPSGQTAFLSAITIGSTKVKLSGTIASGAVSWTSAAID